jgi:citrate synthase
MSAAELGQVCRRILQVEVIPKPAKGQSESGAVVVTPRNVWCTRRPVNIDSTINMKEKAAPWIDATEAIGLLGVNLASLYSYVSRGLIRSEPLAGGTRRRRYSRDDIERLVARNRQRRNPETAAEQALHLGLPVLESGITLVTNDTVYYRGRNVSLLARTCSISEVATLLWMGTEAGDALVAPRCASMDVPCLKRAVPFVAAAQAALALAAAEDTLSHDFSRLTVARTGWRIVWQLVGVASGVGNQGETIDATLADRWGVPHDADLIRAALILCADHELNVSTFAVRCVASAGSSPYNVVIAGLAALEGAKHGGTTARIEALWDALCTTRDLTRALAERFRRDERIDGFGHPLYRHGDPRARLLLDLLPQGEPATFARELARAAQTVLGEAPTLDFALVAATRAMGLPSGTALKLFAIGRTLGWMAHAIEQYGKDVVIRPRAKYVGKQPGA